MHTRRVALVALGLLLAAGCGSCWRTDPGEAARDVPASSLPPSPFGASSSIHAPADAPPTGGRRPHGVRMMAAALAPGARPALLIARGDALSAVRVRESNGVHEPVWTATGPGSVQLVASGDAGDGFALWVVRGRSLADRAAPLVLERLDPATGLGVEAWRHAGPRNEATALQIADVDGDGRRDLALAYFADERRVRSRDRLASGALRQEELGHMATSRLFLDLDGDGRDDEVIGHLYDEDPARAGQLKARIAGAWVALPTRGGIRALAALPEPKGAATLLVSDGWMKRYGAEGRARVSVARWRGGAFELDLVAASSVDYTFFDLIVVGTGDEATVLARGNSTTMRVRRSAGRWSASAVDALAGSESVAVVPGTGTAAPLAFDAADPAREIPLR